MTQMIVKDWFVGKMNVPAGYRAMVSVPTRILGIVRETEKAYLCKVALYCIRKDDCEECEVWIPKSCIETPEDEPMGVATVTTDDIAAPVAAEATCTSAMVDDTEEDEEDGDIENALAYYDGNTGAVIPFATYEEAVREAEIRWAHLTAAERRKFSAPGCYFGVGTVFANGDIDLVLDLTSEEERTIGDWSGTVKVTTTGNSVILKITDAARAMGLERGDYVDVTIRRKP